MTPKVLLSLFARVVVGGVLIYSGASKAIVPSAEFAAVLSTYRVLPHEVLNGVALIWPWIELLVGTYILFGYFTRLFAHVAAGMFIVFLAVLGSALARGIDLASCGCFGVGLSMTPQKTLILDSVLLLFAVFLARVNLPIQPFSADSWSKR